MKPFAKFVLIACLFSSAAIRGRAADAPPKGAMRLFKIAELEHAPVFNNSLVVEECGPYFVMLKSATGTGDPRIVFYYEKYEGLPVKEVVPRSHLQVRAMEQNLPMVEYSKNADGIAIVRVLVSKSNLTLAACLPAPE